MFFVVDITYYFTVVNPSFSQMLQSSKILCPVLRFTSILRKYYWRNIWKQFLCVALKNRYSEKLFKFSTETSTMEVLSSVKLLFYILKLCSKRTHGFFPVKLKRKCYRRAFLSTICLPNNQKTLAVFFSKCYCF